MKKANSNDDSWIDLHMINNKLMTYKHLFVVLCIFIMLSIALTWPLVSHLSTSFFSGEGDAFGAASSIWSQINGYYSFTDPLICAPFGPQASAEAKQPVFVWSLILLAKLFNEIIAFNLLTILSFAMTSFSMYLFLDYLLHSKSAAFVGGVTFGFCPSAVMQAVGGHLTFTLNMFIPIFLIALFYNRSRRTVLSAFFVSLSYALLTLNSLYIGYFALFVILFFVVFDYVTLKIDTMKNFLLNYTLSMLFAVILIVPFQYEIIIQQLSASDASLIKAGRIRAYNDLTAFSARPLEYLLPSIDHPVLGRSIINFIRDNLHDSNLFEQTLYLGVIPLLLCFLGILLWSKKSDDALQRRYFLFFALGALLMLFLSLPPYVSVWNVKLPTVSYFMYKIAPMFRVYARFGILVNFFVACAAAAALTMLSARMPKGRYYLLLALLLPLLIFEYWSIPPNHARSIDAPPPVYKWLAGEPGDVIIAEYPMMKSDEASFYTHLFWQRIHQKRMVNGATPDNTRAWDFFKRVNDLGNSETLKLLREAGVQYVIVHKKMYEEGAIPGPIKRYYPRDAAARQYNDGKAPFNRFLPRPHKIFGDDVVYRLDPHAAETTL